MTMIMIIMMIMIMVTVKMWKIQAATRPERHPQLVDSTDLQLLVL